MSKFSSMQSVQPLRSKLEMLEESLLKPAIGVTRKGDSGESLAGVIRRAMGEAEAVFNYLDHVWPQVAPEERTTIMREWDKIFKETSVQICGNCRSGRTSLCEVCIQRLEYSGLRLGTETLKFRSKIGIESQPSRDSVDHVQPQIERGLPTKKSAKKLQSTGTDAYKDVEMEELSQKYEDAMADLERKAEEIEEARKIAEAVNERLREIELQLQNVKVSIQAELDNSNNYIEDYAIELEDAGKYEQAANTYKELNRMAMGKIVRQRADALSADVHDPMLEEIEIKSLGYRHKLGDMLSRCGNFHDAEVVSRDVWLRRRQMLTDRSPETRASHKLHCAILRSANKHWLAERLYIDVWYSMELREPVNEDDVQWKIENGYQLAMVMAEQRRFVESEVYHRRVLEMRSRNFQCGLDDIANSTLKVVSIVENEPKTDDTIEILNTVWEARNNSPGGAERGDVVTCGHKLGVQLFNRNDYVKAGQVLQEVWETRTRLYPEVALSSADYLSQAYKNSKNFKKGEPVWRWIWQHEGATGPEKRAALQQCYILGYRRLSQGKYTEAEIILKETWEAQQKELGAANPETLQTGHALAQTLEKKPNFQFAQPIIESVLNFRVQVLGPDHIDVLQSRCTYGKVLLGLDVLPPARDLLKDVWDSLLKRIESRKPNISIAEEEKDLLESGHSLSVCLVKLEKPREAIPILAKTLEFKRLAYPPDSPQLIDTARMLETLTAPPPWNGNEPQQQLRPDRQPPQATANATPTGKSPPGKPAKPVRSTDDRSDKGDRGPTTVAGQGTAFKLFKNVYENA